MRSYEKFIPFGATDDESLPAERLEQRPLALKLIRVLCLAGRTVASSAVPSDMTPRLMALVLGPDDRLQDARQATECIEVCFPPSLCGLPTGSSIWRGSSIPL